MVRNLLFLWAVLWGAAALAQPVQPPDEGAGHERRRVEWFLEQRATPQGFIPADLRLKAWREMEAERAKTARQPAGQALSAASWTNVGPFSLITPYWLSPISGRVNAIVTDPRNANVIWIGASEGGIWKSTDGGVTFTAIADSQASLTIGALALDPSNPNTIYAGTGGESYGAGILKSTDGGATWTNYPGPFVGPFGADNYFGGGARILSLAVSPANSNVVLAGVWRWPMTQAGIFRSTDGGATWNQVLAGPGVDVRFLPGSSTRMFATLASYYASTATGLYTSSDAGVTWTPVTSTSSTPLPTGATVSDMRLAMSVSLPSTLYVSVTFGNTPPTKIYKSTDTGASWSLMGIPPGTCCTQLAVDPVDANLLIGGAIGGTGLTDVYRSTDGAASWADISGVAQGYTHAVHADARYLYFVPDGSAFYVGCDAGLYGTGDPHTKTPVWKALSGTLTLTEFYHSFSMHPYNPSVMVGGTQDNGTLNMDRTGGWAQSTCGDAGFSAIDPSNPSVWYTTCQNIDIQKSTAGGAFNSWVESRNGIDTSDRGSFIPPLILDAAKPQTLYFGTYRVYQSTNAAATWSAISGDLTAGTGTISTLSVAPGDSNTVYAGTTDGRVSITTNALSATPTWTRKDKAPLPGRFVTEVAGDPANPQTVYVTYSGFSGFNDKVGHVFRSTDGGTTWSDISSNLPNIPANDIVIDPDLPGTFYLATDLGVYITSNSGGSWAVFGSNLPRVIVNALKLHRHTRTLRAATYGRGIWDISVPAGKTIPVITEVLNATGEATTIGQNTWIEIKGTNLAQSTRIWMDSDFANGQMPTTIDGVSATVNNKPAFVYYVSPAQVNVLTPLDTATGQVAVQITNVLGTGTVVNVSMVPYSLGFFAFNSDKYAAALHGVDYALLGPASLYPGYTTPAKPNENVILYANGFGQISPPIVNGSQSQSGALPKPWPVVTVGGFTAQVTYAGVVSPGLYQLNIVVPANAPDGDDALSATYNGAATKSGVYLAVQR